MAKRFRVVPLALGFIVLAAAALLIWSNLNGTLLFGGGSLAARGGRAAGAAAAATDTARPAAVRPPAGARSGGNPSAALASQPGAQAHPVETKTVAVGILRSYVMLTGEAAAATQIRIFPEVAGKVDRIEVSVGSRVGPQTTLLTVDPSRPGTRYEASPVRSPIAGTVTEILVNRGESVSTTTPAAVVATVGDLELKVRLPERYASIVTGRTTALVSFDAIPNRAVEVSVKRMQPVIDPVSRSKEIVFSIPPGTPGIEPGMFASLKLVSREVSNAVVVPFEAIVQEADASYVFIVEGGRGMKRPVSIGLLAGESVEVLSGLAGGESVVTVGQTFLEDGSPVTVVNKTAGVVPPGSVRN